MKMAARVAKLINKKSLALIAVIMIVVAGGLAWYFTHKSETPSQKLVSQTTAATNQQVSDSNLKRANQNLGQGNYSQAQHDYIMAAQAAMGVDDYQQAISILRQGAAKIPDKYTTWELYSSLAVAAQAANNKQLERDSLKKALAKAELTNSGAPSGAAANYEQILRQLGAG